MFCNETSRQKVCTSDKEFCSCIQIYELELNDLVEIVVSDQMFSSYSHPMHVGDSQNKLKYTFKNLIFQPCNLSFMDTISWC